MALYHQFYLKKLPLAHHGQLQEERQHNRCQGQAPPAGHVQAQQPLQCGSKATPCSAWRRHCLCILHGVLKCLSAQLPAGKFSRIRDAARHKVSLLRHRRTGGHPTSVVAAASGSPGGPYTRLDLRGDLGGLLSSVERRLNTILPASASARERERVSILLLLVGMTKTLFQSLRGRTRAPASQ